MKTKSYSGRKVRKEIKYDELSLDEAIEILTKMKAAGKSAPAEGATTDPPWVFSLAAREVATNIPQ